MVQDALFPTSKVCRKCGIDKPLEAFQKQAAGKYGRTGRCQACRAQANKTWVKANPDKIREYRDRHYAANKDRILARLAAAYDADPTKYRERRLAWKRENPEKVALSQRKMDLKRIYGLTIEQYDTMLMLQGGGCAICGGQTVSGRRLHVDHNHSTGAVRGLLCDICNLGIGKFRDDPQKLRDAADYLEKHS